MANGTWSHEVIVIIPYNLRYTNISVFYGTGGCNDGGRVNSTKNNDEFVLDAIAHEGQVISVLGY